MRKKLRKKEIKGLNNKLKQQFAKEFFNKKEDIIIEDNIIKKDNKPMFFYYKDKLIPSLKLIIQDNFLKKVVIDMPAIPFIIKGADIMRPGIKELDEFEKNEIIVIVDETHQKPLAIGISMFSSSEIKEMDKGKVIKNIHYVGDVTWNQ